MTAQIDGLTTAYRRTGTGRPVLLLHGWGACMDAMAPIENHLAAIGREAVSFDFPGFGDTDAPKEPWGVPEYAGFTRKFIAFAGIEGCDVICHSFGGRVTVFLAAAEPELFGRLILTDAAGVRPKRGPGYYLRVYSYKTAKALSKAAFLDRLFGFSKRLDRAGSDDYRTLDGVMKATFVKVVNLDLTDKLDMIKNETLLVWGENDTATPLYMAKTMEQRIKNSGLAVIPGAGHFSYLDAPVQYMAIIDVLLKEGA